MSAFDEWWDTEDHERRTGLHHKPSMRTAWSAARRHERNATLDQLEGLAEEWKASAENNCCEECLGARIFDLRQRIKELREE